MLQEGKRCCKVTKSVKKAVWTTTPFSQSLSLYSQKVLYGKAGMHNSLEAVVWLLSHRECSFRDETREKGLFFTARRNPFRIISREIPCLTLCVRHSPLSGNKVTFQPRRRHLMIIRMFGRKVIFERKGGQNGNRDNNAGFIFVQHLRGF